MDEEYLQVVVNALAERLPVRPRLGARRVDLEEIPVAEYRPERGQYELDAMLMLARVRSTADVVLGVTDEDVTMGQRNYVFGGHYQNGSEALVSTYRLQPGELDDGDESGREDSSAVFEERLRKEAVKQVGLLLGVLEWCDDRECVFTFTPTVREIGVHGETPCESCHEVLHPPRKTGTRRKYALRVLFIELLPRLSPLVKYPYYGLALVVSLGLSTLAAQTVLEFGPTGHVPVDWLLTGLAWLFVLVAVVNVMDLAAYEALVRYRVFKYRRLR